MKVAIALIYDKVVKPSFFIVEKSWDVGCKFLHGNQRVRQDLIVPKVAPSVDGMVKELVWFPLDNQNKLQITDESSVISL